MAGITIEQAEAQLSLWLTVLSDIAENGQSNATGTRTYTAANLADVQRQVDYWDGKVKKLSNGGRSSIRFRGITPA